jgi:hypothetical protein
LATVTILAVVAVVVGRASSEARAELAMAELHREGGDATRATEHYRRALRWSFPGSPYTVNAVAGLDSIATELEASADTAGALLAWRSLAGGISSTRVLYLGRNRAREKAVGEVARLLAQDRSAGIDANLDAEKLAGDHRRLLAVEISPDPFWAVLLLLGFAVWVGSLLFIARTGFDSAGRLRWASARRPLWGALAGFLSFALGLLFA